MRSCGALALLLPVHLLFVGSSRPGRDHQDLEQEREREREECDFSKFTKSPIEHQKLKCILTDAGFVGSTPVDAGLAFLLKKSREEWPELPGGDVVIWLRDAQAWWWLGDKVIAQRFTSQNKHDYEVLKKNRVSKHFGIWFNRPGSKIMLEEMSMDYEQSILDGKAGRTLLEITEEQFQDLLEMTRLLYVNGDNPWPLAKGLRLSPFQSWLKPVLAGHCIYIGRSSGTIFAGASIDISGHFEKKATLQGESHLPTIINAAGDEVSGLDLLGHLSSLSGKSLVFRPHYESKYPNEKTDTDKDNENTTQTWYEQYGKDESCVVPLRMGPGSGGAVDRFGGDAMLAYGGLVHLVRFDQQFPTIS